MATSSEDSSVPVLKITYQQLLEKKTQKLKRYREESRASTDSDSSPRLSHRHIPGASKRDYSSPVTSSSTTRWESVLINWKSQEKRLDKLCSRWFGSSSDHLEQVLVIWFVKYYLFNFRFYYNHCVL